MPVPGICRPHIAAVLLAGGEGRRMSGADKGLLDLNGQPLAVWALDALAPQAAEIMISANRSLNEYQRLADRVITDDAAGLKPGRGPLAGILAAMRTTSAPWLLTLPCDAPFAPADMARRLAARLIDEGGDIALAEADGRVHPLHALMRTRLRDDLADFLNRGESRVLAWMEQHTHVRVNFDDCASAFVNINTPKELKTQRLRRNTPVKRQTS